MRLLLLLSLIGLTACSQKSAKVNLELTTSFAFGAGAMQAVSQGGLMVWGQSDKGDSFSRVLNDTSSVQLDLPNALWTFSAVAWKNGNNKPLNAVEMRCARTTPTPLTGTAVSVNLSLTQANCASPIFKASASTSLASLKVMACRSTATVSAEWDTCDQYWDDIDWRSYKAPAMSAKVRLVEYDSFGGSFVKKGPGLASSCIAFTNQGYWSVPSDLMLPIGDPAQPQESPFATEVELHPSTGDCTGTLPMMQMHQRGLAGGAHGAKYINALSGTQKLVFLQFSDQDFCAQRGHLAPFAGGNGTKDFPYMICNAAQLYRIHSLSGTPLNYSFRLAANIDLSPFTKGSGNVAGLPANAASCWSHGQTWQPIGKSYSGGCAISSTGLNGSFEGGGYTIKHLRMPLDEENNVGFIGDWAPATAGHYVRDLNFEIAEARGREAVGIVVGKKTTPGDIALIEKIRVHDAEVEARPVSLAAEAGTVGGSMFKVNARDIKVTQARVRGDGDRVGGVFGLLEESTFMSKIYSSAVVNASHGVRHGGIAGQFYTSQTTTMFDGLSHEGVIMSGGSEVGGLFGFFQTTTGVTNAYATSAISAYSSSLTTVGGLFGNANTPALSKAYFAGHISVVTPEHVGRIAGYLGNDPTDSDLYYLSTNQVSILGDGDLDISTTAKTNETSSGGLLQGGLLTSAPWVHPAGGLPRFVDQQHPCSLAQNLLTLASQTGRGSATNPYMVCRKDQLQEVATLSAGQYVQLAGTVHLGGTYTPAVIPTSVTLLGKGGLLMGYQRSGSPASAEIWAPLQANQGTIKDLLVANMNLVMGTTPATSHIAGLVATNSGTIDGLRFLSGNIIHADDDSRASGVIYHNTPSGKLKNFKFYGTLGGPGHLYNVAYANEGLIEDGVVNGVMHTGGSSSPLSYFGGIAKINGDGTNPAIIRRVAIENRFNHAYQVSNLSLGVISNYANATVEDIEITSQANWSVGSFGTNVAQIAVSNSGTVRRTLFNGRLLSNDFSTSTVSHPNVGQPVYSNSGITSGLLTTFPVGRLVYSSAPSTAMGCYGSGSLLLPSGYAGDFTVGGYWEDTADTANDLANNNQYVWVIGENDGDLVQGRAVGSFDTGSSIQINLNRDCTDYSTSTTVMIIQAYGNTTNLGVGDWSLLANNYSGVINPPDVTKANLSVTGSPWLNKILDETDNADFQYILDYFLANLSGQAAVKPAPWSEEGGGEFGLLDIH